METGVSEKGIIGLEVKIRVLAGGGQLLDKVGIVLEKYFWPVREAPNAPCNMYMVWVNGIIYHISPQDIVEIGNPFISKDSPEASPAKKQDP